MLGSGVKSMAESRIIIALEKFSSDYAWDKSLTARASNLPEPQPPLVNQREAHVNTSIEDFCSGAAGR